jgi:hypothetical protein
MRSVIVRTTDFATDPYGNVINGSDVVVGVLSDSYNDLGTSPIEDLPVPVYVQNWDNGVGSDEGRAMLEIVYDVAPGADLAFHTAFDGQASFANGIGRLVAEGAKVIVDDVYYLEEPMFQDGIIAQAVEAVIDNGVAYVSSAGNNARQSHESVFSDSGIDVPAIQGTLHDFDPDPVAVDVLQRIERNR